LGIFGKVEAGYGTTDDFRTVLTNYAYSQIKQSPFVGNGWSFDVGQMTSAISSVGSLEGSTLTMTSSYHNNFLNLAVANGVLLPVVYLAGVFFSVISLTKFARKEKDDDIKYQVSFFLVYSSSMIVMFFVNGSTYELFALSAALGAASAFRDIAESNRETASKALHRLASNQEIKNPETQLVVS